MRSRLRQGDLPKPIQQMKKLIEPRKTKRGLRLKRSILMIEEHQVDKEWTPTLRTAIEARDLRRKMFRAVGTGEQTLWNAFLCNRSLGRKAI